MATVLAVGGFSLTAMAVTRSTLQEKIETEAAKGGGRVTVPTGSHFMDGPLHLRSNVELALADGAELVFTDDPRAYLPAVATAWEAVECFNYSPLIYAYGCTNVAIVGTGTLRAKMGTWKKWFARPPAHMAFTRRLYEWGSRDTPVTERDATKIPGSNARPQFVQFNRCKGVRLDGFRIRDSPFWCVHLYQSEDCTVRNLDIRALGHNSDGIDIDMTRNVLVENCTLDQGDDAFVVKSGRNRDGWRIGRPTENVEIRNCTVVRGHTLLGVGSDLSGGIRNVRIHDCRVNGRVWQALYVKTSRRRGGEVAGIRMENCRVQEATDALVAIDTDVLYQFASLPTYEERLTDIHGIVIRNLTCGTTPRLVRIFGDPACPVRNVTLVGVCAEKVTKTARDVRNCTGLRFDEQSEVGPRLRIPDFAGQLAQPVLPQTAWMSSDRASRAPFGDAGRLVRRTVAAETLATGPYGDLGVERTAYRHANGLELPAVMFVPSQRAGAPVVVLGQSGRFLREPYVTWGLGGWRPVLALDLFGTGEIAGCLENEKGADGETVFAARMKVRGESPAEVRAAELIAVLEDVKARFGAAATVFAGSATFAVAETVRARRTDLVDGVVRCQGQKTAMPAATPCDWRADTAAFQARIDALAAKGGGTLVVEPGLYRLGAVTVRPGVNLHLKKNAVLLGVDDEEAYPKCRTRVEGRTDIYYPAILNADRCDGFRITGEGIVDGLGYSLWRTFWASWGKYRRRMDVNSHEGLLRPRVLFVSDSKDVDVSGVTFKNSKFWTTHFYRCTNLRVRDCAIYADVVNGTKGPSTDAIDLDGCRDVVVSNVLMNVNDDAVVMKGGMGVWANDPVKCPWNAPTENVLVTDCTFGPMCHACLTLGSDCFLGRNATLRNSRALGSALLLHLKMRVDTPQLYENVLVERCTGRVGTYLNAPAWTQMTDLKGLAEPPASIARHVTMRDNAVSYRTFRRLARERFVTYEDFDIR